MVTAQDCGYFAGSCQDTGHYFDYSAQSNCFPHEQCGWCLSGPCHPVCSNCPSFGLNPLQSRLEALFAAAAVGDLDQVLNLASDFSNHVSFNRVRQSVQLRNCTGETIVANLPVRNQAQRQLALRLPSPTLMLARARASEVANGFLPAALAARTLLDSGTRYTVKRSDQPW